jgi:hypothetical protein
MPLFLLASSMFCAFKVAATARNRVADVNDKSVAAQFNSAKLSPATLIDQLETF